MACKWWSYLLESTMDHMVFFYFKDMRPSKDQYYMQIAKLAAARWTCCRAQVGAVIVKSWVIVSTWYNGKARWENHCDGWHSCMVDNHCYVALHAEENAIIAASRTWVALEWSTIYCTHRPCDQCMRRIINAGIVEVFYDAHYEGRWTIDGDQFLKIQQLL